MTTSLNYSYYPKGETFFPSSSGLGDWKYIMAQAQRAEQFHDVLLADIKGHPEVITDLLFDHDDISLILEKRGNVVRFAYMRRYDPDTTRILHEVKQEYAQKVREGYTRERAAQDLIEAQQDIQHQLATP